MRLLVKLALGAAAGLGAYALGKWGYFQLLKKGLVRYNEFDRRVRGTLEEGGPAPDLELPVYEGGTVRLSALWKDRPLVLVFGSCT